MAFIGASPSRHCQAALGAEEATWFPALPLSLEMYLGRQLRRPPALHHPYSALSTLPDHSSRLQSTNLLPFLANIMTILLKNISTEHAMCALMQAECMQYTCQAGKSTIDRQIIALAK